MPPATLEFGDNTVEVNVELAFGFKVALTGRTDD